MSVTGNSCIAYLFFLEGCCIPRCLLRGTIAAIVLLLNDFAAKW